MKIIFRNLQFPFEIEKKYQINSHHHYLSLQVVAKLKKHLKDFQSLDLLETNLIFGFLSFLKNIINNFVNIECNQDFYQTYS